MTSQVVDDGEACLQMALFVVAVFSVCVWGGGGGGSLRIRLSQNKSLSFQRVSDLCAKMTARRFTTDEIIHFAMDIPAE